MLVLVIDHSYGEIKSTIMEILKNPQDLDFRPNIMKPDTNQFLTLAQ